MGFIEEVRFGDVWRVGPHVLACGDVELGHAQDLLDKVGRPNVAYTDPPWNQALASSFRRMAGFDDKPVFHNVLRRVFATIAQVAGAVFVEMGDQNQPLVEGWGKEVGLHLVRSWVVPYGKRTSWLNVLSRDPDEGMFRGADLRYVAGVALPVWAIEHSTSVGHRVFDPCTGLGATPWACHKTGRVFVGMELNPGRLADSIARLAKGVREVPTKEDWRLA